MQDIVSSPVDVLSLKDMFTSLTVQSHGATECGLQSHIVKNYRISFDLHGAKRKCTLQLPPPDNVIVTVSYSHQTKRTQSKNYAQRSIHTGGLVF